MTTFWDKVRAKEVALQRYLRSNASVLEWFAVAVHRVVRADGMLLITCFALFSGYWSWALKALICMCFGEVFNGTIKAITREPRPIWREDIAPSPLPNTRRTWENDYSFPSSHAQVTVCFAICFSYLVPDKPVLWISCYILAVAAGLSRGYLGQHYFHDVIAGWIFEICFMSILWPNLDRLIHASTPVSVIIFLCLFFSSLVLELAVLVNILVLNLFIHNKFMF